MIPQISPVRGIDKRFVPIGECSSCGLKVFGFGRRYLLLCSCILQGHGECLMDDGWTQKTIDREPETARMGQS